MPFLPNIDDDETCPEHDHIEDVEEIGYYCHTCDCCFGCYKVGCRGCGDEAEPTAQEIQEYLLSVWVEEQKRDYHAGKLSEFQIQKLESLPAWVW